MAIERSGQGHSVGASVLRKEDDRHLRGRGQFVAHIPLRGTTRSYFCAAHTRMPIYALFLCHRPLEAGSSPPPTCHGSSRSGW